MKEVYVVIRITEYNGSAKKSIVGFVEKKEDFATFVEASEYEMAGTVATHKLDEGVIISWMYLSKAEKLI